MDLHYAAVHDVIHPTAIFHSYQEADHPPTSASSSADDSRSSSWEVSHLNPKNRIDSLDPPKEPLWRIDGCAGLGTQFYVVPTFIEDIPPLRFDVYISQDAVESPYIRDVLDFNDVFHMRERGRIQRTGVCSYVLRALQSWTQKYGMGRVKALYYEQPFGTRIMLANLPLDIRDVEIHIIQMHNIESHHLSPRQLMELWSPAIEELPPPIDIFRLTFVQQLHDSVCLVRYRGGEDSGHNAKNGEEGEVWVMKALTSGVKYMYHELRVLLAMPPHPNVIARPTRLVTKQSEWNKNKTLVVGFIVPYYTGGGLRDELPVLRMNGLLELRDQARWATQICTGLLHIQEKAKTYYPDLRLDQIVVSSVDQRLVILDFEQRGVWCEFASPEINAIEYTRLLALDDDADVLKEASMTTRTRPSADATTTTTTTEDPLYDGPNEPYAGTLTRLLPGWEDLCFNEDHYKNPPGGYNVPWLCLTRAEHEYAQVYMLGRLLWCLFEGMSAPQRGAIWASYRHEPEFDFPEFRRTPPALRRLIDACTRGRRGQLSSLVVRKGSKLVLRREEQDHHNNKKNNNEDEDDDDDDNEGTAEEIEKVATAFWKEEIKWADEFLREREVKMAKGTWDANHFGRPSLREVASALDDFRATLDS